MTGHHRATAFLMALQACFLAFPTLNAQQAKIGEDVPIVFGQQWHLRSAALGEDRTVLVRLPASYDSSTQSYPVLVVLDGEGLFVPASAIAETFPWALRGPEMIIVGIVNTHRGRDLTTPWPHPGPGQWVPPEAGGADRFLTFLSDELLPAIERRYRTAPFRILVGQSLSALFALHAFAARPGLFNATIAVSPPAFWNDDEIMGDLSTLFAHHPSLSGSIFVSRAEREFDDTPRAFGKLGELLRLRAPRTLRWQTTVIPGEDHGTAAVPGIQQGLELAFADWRDPELVFDEGIDSVQAYYRMLSSEYGVSIAVPVGELAGLARASRDPQSTARVYSVYAQLYPASIDAQEGLGRALAATNELRRARDAYQKAVSLAESAHDARLPDLRATLDSVVSRLRP